MTITDQPPTQRSKGISYQQLLDTDTHPVPRVLREENPIGVGPVRVPVERYTSRAWFDLEVERLWKRVWQMACREEHIPRVGDHIVYEIVDLSFIVVRVSPTQIKAFWNSCLHRGRLLRDRGAPQASEFRCPFHGFCWNIDGSLKQIPCEWDFPHIDKDNFNLPEAKVGIWGGFVFINPDPKAESLESFLGPVLTEQFHRWPLEDRYVQAHVAKIMRCNWKACQEAFSEAFHVVATHPQLLAGIGDANSQYDVWGNVSRAITPNGTPSPHLSWTPTEQEIYDAMTDRRLDEPASQLVPEGKTAREVGGAMSREMMRPVLGGFADEVSDAEFLDSFYFTVFPNFHPWGAYNRIVYRFRPYGNDPDTSIMECLYLAPYRGERPPPAEIHWLGPDDDWCEAPELGGLARVFNQDSFNLPSVQRGLKAGTQRDVVFALYNETKVRHLHYLLGEWMSRS